MAFGLGELITPCCRTITRPKNRPDLGVPYDPNTLKPLMPVTRYYGVMALNMEDITTDITTARLDPQAGQPNELNAQLRHGRYDRLVLVTAPAPGGVSAGVPVTDNTQIAPGAKLRGSLNETTALSLTTPVNSTRHPAPQYAGGVDPRHAKPSTPAWLMNGTTPI